MKRALFVSLVLANAIVLAGPDTLIRHEDFNSAWSPSSPPTDWRIVYSGGSGGDTWNRRTGFPWTGNSTAYAGIWFATSSNHTDSLISPLLDCSRVRNITLRCSTYFLSRVAAAYTARILYSDDSGTTWRVVRDYANDSFGPGREVISLDTIGLRRNVFLAWVWSGDLANINWWCLDNVTVTGQAVRDTDITAKKVLRPERIELPGLPFHPSAIFQNIGTQSQVGITAYCEIYKGSNLIYGPWTVPIPSLAPSEQTTISFPTCDNANEDTIYTAVFYSVLAGDQDASNDTIVTYFHPTYLDQIRYDDDSAVGASHWSIGGNSGWGLRIRPLYYPALVRASQFSLRLPDSLGSYGYRLRIVDGNGPLGTPGTTLYQSPVLTASSGWNTDSLADRQIILRSGDCYLFYLQGGDWPSCAELNYDLSRDTLASFWQLRDGSYSQDNDTSRGDWMIRCLLDYNPPSSLAYDAHAVYVSAPEDELSLRPFGVSYVPSVRIENLGDSTLTDLPVICSIPGTGFSSRRTIDTLDSGAGLLVDFDPWAPLTSGTYEIRVWVDHALDQDRGNDTVSKSVQVLHPRYTGGPEILDRYAWIDSDTTGGPTYEWIDSTGAYILISADADLYISQALPFYFVYRDTFYDRIWVGNNGWLSFDPATSVASENDTIPNPAAPNNALYPFWDHLRAGAGPLSRVWYRTLGYAPGRKFVVTWDNMRFADVPGDTDLISFQVILDEESHNITFQYRDVTGSSSNHSFGRSATVGIENRDGTIGLQYLCGDSLGRGFWPANKLTSGRAITFFQVRRDMACREILEPHRYGLPGPVTPRVRVKNYGNIMDAFYVHVRFDSLLGGTDWHDSVLVNFLPMQTETTLTFGTWDARFGNWRMVCSTALAGDANPANDAIRQDVSIQSWLERASIPQGDYRKRVKYGAITYLDPYVYVLKGSNTNEFWRYDPRADSWDTLPSLPAGEGNRKAKDGCCLTADPSTRLIFATKGGNRLEFYAYNPATQTWMVRESIPWGTNGRGARNGTCMDYGFDKIFFLKGASTNEFYIYSVSGDSWVTGRGPIVEGSKISVRRGTSLAVFDTLVYCPNPHNRYGFLCYNIWDSTWRTRPTVPGGYRNRKVRAGSGSAIVGNTLYLTKGGNTNELWAYDLLGDTAWTPKADIPLGTYGKRIKTGGCMAKSDNYLFVLKGGNTTEFWIYAPAVDTVRMPDRQRLPDAQGKSEQLAMSFACRAATNPVTGPVTLQLALPKSLAARIKVFDITGGFVATIAQGVLPAGRHEFTWKRCDDYARPVANGIYILRFESDEFRSSQKLVLE